MTDYTDLIARLRQVVPRKQGFSGYYPDLDAIQAQQAEAAAAIEDLQAEVARLQADKG